MNQLLSACDGFVVTGMKDRAFFVCTNSNSISELVDKQEQSPSAATNEESSSQTGNEKFDKENIQKTDEEMKEVFAVAITRRAGNIWCAVSRGAKTISIYKLHEKENDNEVEPILVYKSQKRVGCLCFAEFPNSENAILVLVAGDLAGDAYAYGVEQKGQRLLLGHTASMLTGVCVVGNQILTADRDEKIRVSSFPESYVIEGFLLGHTAYLTSMDTAATEENKISLVVSCGGDSTIRLWNIDMMQQISEHVISKTDNENQEGNGSSAELVPTDVAIDPNGGKVAVIFDQSNRLDIYNVLSSSTNLEGTTLHIDQSVDCPSQPLSITFQDKDTLLVLMRDPDFLMAYKVADSSVDPIDMKAVSMMKQEATEKKLVMPETILEKDNNGQPKLKKILETRTHGADAPWNRVERVDIAKERNRRHKRRKHEKIGS